MNKAQLQAGLVFNGETLAETATTVRAIMEEAEIPQGKL